MIISDLSIRRSTTVLVLLLIIVVMGGYSYIVLPRESEPEVIIPFVNVSTTYEGVSPEDIETLVTIPIERKLAGMKGVEQLLSESVEGQSSITIEFKADFNVDDSLQRVRDKVSQAKGDIPVEAEEPVITEINAAEQPVFTLSLTGDIGLAALSAMAEDLQDDLEAIKGVLDVNIIGDLEREIQIIVDPDRVAQYGISLAELAQITALENVNTPSGAMELGEAKYLMRVPGEIRTPDELTGLVVKRGETGVVYLRDIAEVRDGFKEMTSKARVNGTDAVSLTVSKRAGENVIAISEEVKDVVAKTQRLLPPGVSLELTMDESEMIRDMVSELESSILSGLILVLVIIFVFLGLSNAFFVALAIPVSMLITFVVLLITGMTLNMVVLFSLILALGMLVDNGIVVVENIYRHMQEGADRVTAARQGAAEVAWPIMAATLTTVAAFFPLLFWPGLLGSFMSFLPKTVIVALLASLFVGLIVNPALASRFMVLRSEKAPTDTSARPLVRAYAGFVRSAVRWRGVTLTAAATLMVVIGAVYFAGAEIEFMPEAEPLLANIDVICPEGTSLDTSDYFVNHVENIVAPAGKHVDYVLSNVGWKGVDPRGMFITNTPNESRVILDFPDLEEAEVLPSEVVRQVRENLPKIPGAEIRIAKETMGPPTEAPVNVEISGDDYETLAAVSQEIQDIITGVDGVVDIRDDYDKGKPEVRVVVDREQAWLTGLNTQFIGATVKAAVQGQVAAKYREGDEEYDVVVRFPESFRADLRNIENMTLVNLEGRPIPFSAVAKLEQGQGLGSIVRIDRKRTVTVSADVEGRPGAEALRDVQAELADYRLPAGYTIAYTGENEDVEETEAFLSKAFVVALLLIMLVMVTQFNSVLQPAIILTSVILSLAGVFLGLLIFDMPFGVLMTGLGVISLAGVVVNNGIVLVDFINQLRTQGLSTEEAIVQGSVTRFRPVMLTAITTILGLVPMAIGVTFDFRSFQWIIGGMTAQYWGPMAIAVIFGLTFATVLTLVVVPALYSLTDSIEQALLPKGRRQHAPAPAPAELKP